jgi:hypothetical protein
LRVLWAVIKHAVQPIRLSVICTCRLFHNMIYYMAGWSWWKWSNLIGRKPAVNFVCHYNKHLTDLSPTDWSIQTYVKKELDQYLLSGPNLFIFYRSGLARSDWLVPKFQFFFQYGLFIRSDSFWHIKTEKNNKYVIHRSPALVGPYWQKAFPSVLRTALEFFSILVNII